MMRILITGGAGCLGSNLLEHWLPLGHTILVIDNFATGRRELVPSVPRLQLVEGSIADSPLVERCFREFQPDVIVHAAASYKDPTDWVEDARTNVEGSINVAKAARLHGTRRLVNLQTALCYGRPQQLPVPVTHPTAPFTSYGISKTAGEQFMQLARVPMVSFRLANVAGPRLAIGPIPTFYKRLKAGQRCFCSDTIRDFLAMEDFLRLMDQAIQPGAPVGFFNVSSGEGHSIKEVFDCVAAHLAAAVSDVPIVPPSDDDVRSVVLDPAETLQVFGWSARVPFADVLKRQLEWYDAHGVSETYSHLSASAASA
jgi:nucleoside-diphosphate-sugar epimerase